MNGLSGFFRNEIGGLHFAVRRAVGTGVDDVAVVAEDASELSSYLVATVDTSGAVVCWPDVIGVQFADGSVDINKSYPQNGIYYRPHNRRDERPFARRRQRLIPIETLQISNVLGPHSREIQYYRNEISYFGPVSGLLFVVPERPNRDCRIDHSDPTRFGTIRIRSGSDSVPKRVAESSRGIGSATHRSAARDASNYRSGCIQPSLESTTVTDL